MLPFILRTDIRIVTNSIVHAHYLAQHQIPRHYDWRTVKVIYASYYWERKC